MMADLTGHDGTYCTAGDKQAMRSLRIEFGRRKLAAKEARTLSAGTIVSLDAATTDEVDVYQDGLLIARGEASVFKGKMCIRITQVIREKAKAN